MPRARARAALCSSLLKSQETLAAGAAERPYAARAGAPLTRRPASPPNHPPPPPHHTHTNTPTPTTPPPHPPSLPTPAPRSFNNLYTLQGGIQNYMREEGLDHWNGSLFVFDGRMAIRYSESAACAVLRCAALHQPACLLVGVGQRTGRLVRSGEHVSCVPPAEARMQPSRQAPPDALSYARPGQHSPASRLPCAASDLRHGVHAPFPTHSMAAMRLLRSQTRMRRPPWRLPRPARSAAQRQCCLT